MLTFSPHSKRPQTVYTTLLRRGRPARLKKPGSFTFSRNAGGRNDENLLIIHDPALARKYVEEVDRLMN